MDQFNLGLGCIDWHYVKGGIAIAVFFFTGFGTCLLLTANSTGRRPREILRKMVRSSK